MRPEGVGTLLIKGPRGGSHRPQSCCPPAAPHAASSPGPALLLPEGPARHWAPGARHEGGHGVGGPAADSEGGCLRSPVLLVRQGAARLTMAREGPEPGSAQRPAQPPARPLGPTMPHQGGAPDAAGSTALASGVCHLLVRPLRASVPAPTSGGPPGPRSSACWPGPQEDSRRSWHFSEPGTVSPQPRWLISPYCLSARNGPPPISLLESH